MIRTSSDGREAAKAGAFAGLFGGIALSIFMTVMTAAAGKDVWYGLKGTAAPFLHERATQPGFDLGAVALGVGLHLAISATWGVLFALVVYHLRRSVTWLAGVAWAFVVWIGMYYVVLPLAGLSAMRDEATPSRAIFFHLIFSTFMTAGFAIYERVFDHGRAYRPAPALT